MEKLTVKSVEFWEKFQIWIFKGLNNIWNFLPKRVGFLLSGIIVIVTIPLLRGNWMLISICVTRQFSTYNSNENRYENNSELVELPNYHFKDLHIYIMWSVATSFTIYFPVGIFFHWYFYYKQRENANDWKIQPQSFLSWEEQKAEIMLGALSLIIASIFSAFFTCYFNNRGPYSTLYFDIYEMGLFYYVLSIPILFLYVDATVYYAHRLYHVPFLYRKIHKYHHKFKQPTPFAATAMHPLEILTYELLSYVPLFTLPIHWTVFFGHSLYVFYYSLEAHCGVKITSVWPWQPSTTFHDHHHQYTHYNFGFNTVFWDKIHKTYRAKKS